MSSTTTCLSLFCIYTYRGNYIYHIWIACIRKICMFAHTYIHTHKYRLCVVSLKEARIFVCICDEINNNCIRMFSAFPFKMSQCTMHIVHTQTHFFPNFSILLRFIHTKPKLYYNNYICAWIMQLMHSWYGK